MKVIHDIQCSWCGGREVIDCLTCDHVACQNCEAGGYCDCKPPQDDKCLTCGGEGCDK